MKGEKLVKWIQDTSNNVRFDGIELATVTTTTPKIEIKIDGMEHPLGASFLVVPKRFYTTNTQLSGQWTVTGESKEAITDTTDGHSHGIPPIGMNTIETNMAKTELKEVLNVGDRVAVMPAMGGKRYMVLDKVVVD